ncbi:hypothetical protein GCM10009557_91340 [Virgisporangium ochraceum]|uniref:Uncharacterized protein n=1 Tax=Virgisporangium ochraceum TaxID=65505 RepID=A0A8J4EF44_9ACTN|nr:hypothetical protein [Virgisporangium ochraceum]GIJ72298.1 hypothetical protein Voc01_072150 [Virgisporangium ochraceum]
MPRPLDLLHRAAPDASPEPAGTNFRAVARRLAPLIDRMANGHPLTLTQLADVALGGWQLLDGLSRDSHPAGLVTE